MLDALYRFDVWLFQLINEGIGQPYLDTLMLFVTDFKRSWVVAAFASLYLIFTRRRESMLPLALCLLAIAVADQMASGVLKPLVQRTRPCFELERAVAIRPNALIFVCFVARRKHCCRSHSDVDVSLKIQFARQGCGMGIGSIFISIWLLACLCGSALSARCAGRMGHWSRRRHADLSMRNFCLEKLP